MSKFKKFLLIYNVHEGNQTDQLGNILT